jgi:tryptophan synthase alpha chain
MRRISDTFARLKTQQKKALITFIMAGDPDFDRSLSLLKALPEYGADIIELGMPFSDPAADGLTIQKAGQRALAAGASMQRTLEMVREFRAHNQLTPIVLMGYANPLYTYGLEAFAIDAAKAGVDGLIIVDLPPEEDAQLQGYAAKAGLDVIRLVTPTTDAARLSVILDGAHGFLYYVSITGVTGAARANLAQLSPHIDMIRKMTDLPIAIGFGIRTPNDAQEMSSLGDGVVVGSGIIEKMIENQDDKFFPRPLEGYIRGLSNALGRTKDAP